MGKKKSRTSQTSKGEVGSPMKTRLRHNEEGYASQRMMNQLKAFNSGKRVMVTIKNPNGAETNKQYIRVPAKDVWKSSKR
tara:strand:+ start:714 stop:953 length:240 start_codon:yes stop_codon:yes gene_type:complete